MSNANLSHRRKTYDRGRWAEKIAVALLVLKGYRIVARRFRTRFAEIDLVARRGKVIAFVEVKQRADRRGGLEAISRAQQMRISEAAMVYLSTHPPGELQPRFDVIVVVPRRLPLHLENAWEYALGMKSLS